MIIFLQYYPSMITKLHRIHVHVRISHAILPGMYSLIIHYLVSPPMTYLLTVLTITYPGYVYVITWIRHQLQTWDSNSTLLIYTYDISANYFPVSGFRSIPRYTNQFCDYKLIGGCFLFNRKFQITQWLIHSCFNHWINSRWLALQDCYLVRRT